MKLYTEEQVRKMLIETDKFTPLNIDYLIKDLTPIELPSDEEIENSVGDCMHGFYKGGFEEGAKWMRDKIKGGNQ